MVLYYSYSGGKTYYDLPHSYLSTHSSISEKFSNERSIDRKCTSTGI